MDTLCVNFIATFDSYVREYIKKVASKLHISEEDLLREWEECSKFEIKKVDTKSETKKVEVKSETKSEVKKVVTKIGGCPYVFSKGEKSGKACGSKSKDGSLYCSLHKKHEDKEPKQAKLPEPKSKVAAISSTKHLFVKNSVLGKPVHKDTGLVIRSSEDRTVIGKCVNNSLIKLELDDVETCKKLGYNYSFIDLEDEPNHVESKISTEESTTVTKPVTKISTEESTTVTKPVTKPMTKITKTKPVTNSNDSVTKSAKGVDKTTPTKVFRPEPKVKKPKVEKEDTEEELMEAAKDEVQSVKKSDIEEDTRDEDEVNLIDEEDEAKIVKKAFGLQ